MKMRKPLSHGSEWIRNNMKISKERLKEIIKEEVNKFIKNKEKDDFVTLNEEELQKHMSKLFIKGDK